jgi:hypothetical protein
VEPFTSVYSVTLDCAQPDTEHLCHIPLPHQSPLGIYKVQQYRRMGEWPATFLCLLHGRAFVRSRDHIQHEIEMRVPGEPVPQMWQIEVACARENCGRRQRIYTARAPDPDTLLKVLMRKKPVVPCGDHDLIWREDLISLIEFAHESLVR